MRTSLKFPLIALSVVSLLSLGVRAQSSKPLRITTDTKNSVQHIEKIIFGALNNQGIMIPETTVSVTSKDGKVTVDGSLNTDITVNVGKDLTMSSLIGGWLNTLLEAKWSSLIGGKMNQMRSQFNTLWGGVNNTLTGETIYGVMIAGEGNQLSGGQSVLLGGSGNRLEGKINTLINANHTQLRGQNNLLLGVHNANISGEHLFVWGNLDSLEADRLMFLGGKLAIKTPTPHQDAMITLSGDLRIAENTNKNNEIINTPEYSGAIKTVSKEGFFCSCSFDGEKWNPMIKDSLLCQVLCAGEEDRSRRPKPGECGPAQGKNFNNL